VRPPETRAAARRIAILRGVLIALFLALAARAAHLTIASEAGHRATSQFVGMMEIQGARGGIYDRDYRELALTVRAPSVYAFPGQLESPQGAAQALAPILGLDAEKLETHLRNRHRYTFVKRWVTKVQADQVRALELDGVGIVKEPRRRYPSGPLASFALGLANIDGEGVRGIEQQEDHFLRGHTASLRVFRDARRRVLAVDPAHWEDVQGGDVASTIDLTLQARAEDWLAESLAQTGAKRGGIISLDPHTGEILVMAEAPGFDPNDFGKVAYADTRSRIFLDAIEPGSTMKIFTIAAALEATAISATEEFDCGTPYRIKGKTFRDHDDLGVLPVGGVLKHSSNVGSVQIAERLGPRAHFDSLLRFGFGRSTGSGFPFESAGILRHWSGWKPLDHATIAFGQGMNVTLVQLAAATAAIANGGELIRPRLVLARRTPGSAWQTTPVERVRRVISRDTAASVLEMMEGVVTSEGTGRRAGLRGVRVAGKTGTAQKLDAATGRYSNTRYTALFVGAVPADDPRVVIVVAVDEPQGRAHGGGDVAAPLFAKVATAHLASLGIVTSPEPLPWIAPPTQMVSAPPPSPPVVPAVVRPSHDEVEAAREIGEIVLAAAVASEAKQATLAVARQQKSFEREPEPTRLADRLLMPDLLGRSLSEVQRVAAASSFDLHVNGTGRAVEQAPEAGTILVGNNPFVLVRFQPGGEG
jgi:cell division protein FtsI (penicillin-binding protein 3)